MTVVIPDKLYFKIGEVAALLQIKTHVLRYWETEFPMLQPLKSRSNQRLYRRTDVETALMIKDMLYHQGFTIAGARRQLTSARSAQIPPDGQKEPSRQVLEQIKLDLRKLQRRLSDQID